MDVRLFYKIVSFLLYKRAIVNVRLFYKMVTLTLILLSKREWKTAGPCLRHRFSMVSSEKRRD